MNTLRGYGQMTIGGQTRPFHVGTNQTAIFCDLRKMDLVDYNDMFASLLPSVRLRTEEEMAAAQKEAGEGMEVSPSVTVPPKRRYLSPGENRDFIFSSLAAGAENDHQPVTFDALQVGRWLDDEEEESAEHAKPINMQIELMQQRFLRQMERLGLGNAPAPKSGASPAKKTNKKK